MFQKQYSQKTSLYHSNEYKGLWKGNSAKYGAIHAWVRSRKIKPIFCEKCNKKKAFDLSNISGEYKRVIS